MPPVVVTSGSTLAGVRVRDAAVVVWSCVLRKEETAEVLSVR